MFEDSLDFGEMDLFFGEVSLSSLFFGFFFGQFLFYTL